VSDHDDEYAERRVWNFWRTCSRVSGGPCADCRGETRFGYWSRSIPREVLCVACWEVRYDLEAAAARSEEKRLAAIDREQRAAFAREEVRRRREGLPCVDGWHREGSLIVNDATGEKRGFF
jgi:hypothetical protein